MKENGMKELHAGYASGAVLDLMSQLDPELDWHAIIRSLCYFAIYRDIGGKAKWPAELSIFNNLISRGLPTLSSIHVETFLADGTRQGFRGHLSGSMDFLDFLTDPVTFWKATFR